MNKEIDMKITYESASELAAALVRAATAHGVHEAETGEADPDWPIWYSDHMASEQAAKSDSVGLPR